MYIRPNERTVANAEESMLDNTLVSMNLLTNPYELELQSWCKRTLKHRVFQGFYLERRYVEQIKDYRDVISLHKSEDSFDKTLRDVRDKLQLFYSHQNSAKWIGITNGIIKGIDPQSQIMLDTYLWVDIKDLAFGHYWFSIKTVRFLNNEIILTLKEVKSVEEEGYASNIKSIFNTSKDNSEEPADVVNEAAGSNVSLEDFKILFVQWQESIKQTIYNFMSHDISKENFKAAVKFFGLFVVSLISFAFMGVKYLGVFSLRFLHELNRFIYVSTPIIIKLMDVLTKIIGALFIFLTMIWKDLFGYSRQHNTLQYNRPIYKRRSIRCETRR